ncbi:MAG: GDP-mannose 4,6-dehydratase [Kiritimatiellae bacterium]|nr:GDP-mannose 4,6-dehydratase [Kiritimatiellia bacterium]
MRVLVTGARGFVGRHLAADLTAAGHEVLGLSRPQDCPDPGPSDHLADICNPDAVSAIVQKIKPDGCIHLAGIAFVPIGWKQPRLVYDVNVGGALNILEALRSHAPTCRVVMVSSSLVYGSADPDRPRDEKSELDPESIYAVSKVAADLNALVYARHHKMAVMTARPCNHIGPGQASDFMAPAFARQLAAIAAGTQEPVMRVGNLESVREFMDVRDVAQAYRLMLERGHAGESYNISASRAVKISFVLEELCKAAGVHPTIETDPHRWRPTDKQPTLIAEKLRRDTGWAPHYTLEQTLRDVYASVQREAV